MQRRAVSQFIKNERKFSLVYFATVLLLQVATIYTTRLYDTIRLDRDCTSLSTFSFMANMPSTIYPQQDNYYNPAEVPGGEFDINFLSSFPIDPSDWAEPYAANGIKQDSIPVPKSEPYLPEFEPSSLSRYVDPRTPPVNSWYPQHHNLPVMAYQQGTPPPNLQLSDPPTPAAECQVTSTKLSPFPNSPGVYSPHNSEVSFEGQDGSLEFLPDDLGEINIKGLTEEQLVSLSARDLNRLCRDMPEDIIKQLKKRRRTLKNRGYAYNSRVRRVSQKATLEDERDALKKQLVQMQEKVRVLERESDLWKKRAHALERGEV